MQLTALFNKLSTGSIFVASTHLSLELSFNFLPIAYPLFIKEIGLTYAQVGTVAMVAIISATLLQPLFGYLSDRFDSRSILLLSIVWIGTIMGLTGLVRSYWLLIVVVAFGGLGSAAFHPAAASLASAVAGKRRGASMSLFSVGGNLGAALSPLLVGAMLLHSGLRGTVFLIPLIWLYGLVLYRQLRQLPAESHLDVGKGAAEATKAGDRKARTGPWLALLLVVLIAASRSWFHGALSTYLPEWLQSQGWSPESSGTLLSILLGNIAIGSLTGGTASDRVGRVPVILVSLALLGPVLWLLLHTSGVVQVVFVALMGVIMGATLPVTLLMAQEAWPRSVGLASSLAIGFGWLPAGVGAWMVGVVADRSTLTAGLSTLVIAPVVGIAAGLLFRARYR